MLHGLLNASLKLNFDVPLLSVLSHIFLIWGSVNRNSVAGYFSKCKFNVRCLTVFWMHFFIQFSLCFIISIIIFNYLFGYFIIPLFSHSFNCFKWAFLCHHLASFHKLGHLAAYFGQFFFEIISFYLILYMALPCSKSVYTHILRCDLCWFHVPLLALNDSMSYYCFRHYFNDISMVTVF